MEKNTDVLNGWSLSSFTTATMQNSLHMKYNRGVHRVLYIHPGYQTFFLNMRVESIAHTVVRRAIFITFLSGFFQKNVVKPKFHQNNCFKQDETRNYD